MTDSSVPVVAAVIVTFNRAALLKRLLQRLDECVVVPDVVVIVDNCSSDDTADVVAECGEASTIPYRYERLGENLGGAGGFSHGMTVARSLLGDRDDTWLWLMDDDGLPAPDCLERQLAVRDGLAMSSPLVIAEGTDDTFAFPLRKPGSTQIMRTVPELLDVARTEGNSELSEGMLLPFNGTLIDARLIDQIGTVRAEYFIWGDEIEYMWRATEAGARVAMVNDARYWHPSNTDLGVPMMGGKFFFLHSPSDVKHYCICRNHLANLKRYRSPAHIAFFVAKTVWFYTVTRPNPRRLVMSLKAMRDGWQGRFTEHTAYLAAT